MAAKDYKNLKPYREMEIDPKLHPRHRLVIRTFNRIQDEIRSIVFGKELQSIATSAGIGLFSVSDINPGFITKELRQVGGELKIEDLTTPSILVSGNIILIGPPGGAKTLTAKTLAAACGLTFKRVQMTPDLTPRDLTVKIIFTGTETAIRFGPAFAHVLLADEINRATPKAQAALLERMTSGTLTYEDEQGNEITKILPQPCFTMATENSAELGGEGTYPLPEAQLDRFMFGIDFPMPSKETMKDVLDFVPGLRNMNAGPLTSADELLDCRDFIMNEVEVSEDIKKYIIRLMLACRNPFDYNLFSDIASELGGEDLVKLPPNSRAALHAMHAAKTLAGIGGNRAVTYDNVKKRFYELVNHRFVLSDRAIPLSRKYGDTRQFIKLLIKGDTERGIKGILDVVPIDSDE